MSNYTDRYLEAVYLTCFKFVTQDSNKGFEIKTDSKLGIDLQPLIRCESMLKKKIYPRIGREAQNILRKEMVSLLEKDPGGVNKEGVINFDSMMIQVFNALKINKERNSSFYKTVF